MNNTPTSTLTKTQKRKKSSAPEMRVSILGHRNVGKSAIAVRLLTNRFIMEYQHGVDLRFKHELQAEGEILLLDMLDCSSTCFLTPCESGLLSNRSFELQPGYLNQLVLASDLLLLVYSITDRHSFKFVQKVLAELSSLKGVGGNWPLVFIMGNKCDLVHLRYVSSEEAEILCQDYGQCVFLGEVSAAEQPLNEQLAEMIKHFRRRQCRPTLIDRVVLGIRSNVNSNSNNISHSNETNTNTLHPNSSNHSSISFLNNSTSHSTLKETSTSNFSN